MKKLFVVLLALVLIFALLICVVANRPEEAVEDVSTAAEDTAAESAEAAEPVDPADVEIQELDYDAIYALYPGDMVVMTAAGEDITWDEYFESVKSNGLQIEDYFRQMGAYYGETATWEGSVGDGTGMTFAEYPIMATEDSLAHYAAVEALAKERGITLSEENAAATAPEQLAADALGEGATVGQLEEALEEQLHMSVNMYQHLSEINALFGQLRTAEFGENGELADEADVVAYLEEAGYVSANHILLMTMDRSTGEALDEAAVAEKKAKADEIYAELSAITDTDKLVERFKELKAEYCEDSGAAAFPDGYTYTPNTMVSEFEQAAAALEDYGVSEPVESAYGYHIILRMPLTAENLLYSSGMPDSARVHYAYDSFSDEFQQYAGEHAAVYADGFEKPDLLSYIK